MSVIPARAFGTVHLERVAGAIAAMLLVVGCTAPLPPAPSAGPSDGAEATTAPSASATHTASTAPTDVLGAELHVIGTGQFDCWERINYGGCQATFAVKRPDEALQPLLTDGTFTLEYPTFKKMRVSGTPSGLPARLEPGQYELVASVIGISDVLNQDGSYMQTGPFAVCTHELAVTPATSAAWVQVIFEKGGKNGAVCSIVVTADDSARLEI